MCVKKSEGFYAKPNVLGLHYLKALCSKKKLPILYIPVNITFKGFSKVDHLLE